MSSGSGQHCASGRNPSLKRGDQKTKMWQAFFSGEPMKKYT